MIGTSVMKELSLLLKNLVESWKRFFSELKAYQNEYSINPFPADVQL